MKFEIFNPTFIKGEDLKETLEKIFPEEENKFVNIVFVSESEIKRLNSEFRKKNELTDVLSFNLSDEISEIYVCPEYIKKNAQDFEDEIIRVIIHGILHIKGYNHEGYFDEENINEEMFRVQERYVKKFYDILEK